MPIQDLFPTRLYRDELSAEPGFEAFNAELYAACRMLAEEDGAGRAWSRQKGYGGYTSYASLNDLPLRAPAFAELKRRLDRHAVRFVRDLGLDLGRRPRLDSLWVNVLKPGAGHSGHIHPHSVLSGTVYVALPEGSAAIRFEDPRLPLMMARPTLMADQPEAEQPFVLIRPRVGTVLMWESWLRHEVPANAAKSERISISFNYA